MQPSARAQLDPHALPAHVGIIMDGNGRWATKRRLPRAAGHRAGVERLRSIIRMTSDLGIKMLSVYAFSTENWGRPAMEIEALMGLLVEFLRSDIQMLHDNNVRIRIMGDISRFSRVVRQAVEGAVAQTAGNTGLTFNIALNYGTQDELARACRMLADEVARGARTMESIDSAALEQYLYCATPVDLLIRTSGEQRLSNFMCYQAAYAEMVFVETLWPDFDDEAYAEALLQYQGRQRRFGALCDR